MGFFSHLLSPRSDDSDDLKQLPEADQGDSAQVLGELIKIYAQEAFAVPTHSLDKFRQQVNSWSAFLGGEAEAPAGFESEGLAALKGLFENYRKKETRYVQETIPNIKNGFLELIQRVKGCLDADAQDDQEIAEAAESISQALQNEDQEQLRETITASVKTITDRLANRQARNQEQLENLAQQVKELRTELSQAKEESNTDALTGLANRRALEKHLEHDVMVAHLTGEPLSVLMLDVDHFKKLNDTYGHAAGDRVLAALGDLLIKSFPRKTDRAARYGGEEFTVLLPNVEADQAEKLAERFLEKVRDLLVPHAEGSIRLTCSVGVAALKPSESGPEVRERADAALYQAKYGGRDQVYSAEE